MKIAYKIGFILPFQFTYHRCSTRDRTFLLATKARRASSSVDRLSPFYQEAFTEAIRIQKGSAGH